MPVRDLLSVRNLSLDAPGGRPLIRDLTLRLGAGERVALVGRNGVGKSSLLDVLAGRVQPDCGDVRCTGARILVPQLLDASPTSTAEGSPGEQRKRVLGDALEAKPDLLLLDEPTHDLDRQAIDWLVDWLRSWKGGLIAVSHDRRVLRAFNEFFVVAESGCRHFSGSFDDLVADLEREREATETRYVRTLNHLHDKERRSESDRLRRQRKKHLGRIREIGRCPSRALLNDKRSYAQEKQAKRRLLREARIGEARQWAKATRRALAVQLPLDLGMPALPSQPGVPVATLSNVGATAGDRTLFEGQSLTLSRQRLAITGPNGCGKSTLLEILVGNRVPDAGTATRDGSRIGYIAQNASNWRDERSVIDHLLSASVGDPETAAQVLRAHRFPFALADRPLVSLSPGERLRAALICLCRRSPCPELLILDEPTDHLDFLGTAALESVLRAWPGGLMVVSHDEEFLQAIGVEQRVELGLPS